MPTLDPGLGRAAPDGVVPSDTTARVTDLQDDLRVLVEHLTSRVDGTVPPQAIETAPLTDLSTAAGLLSAPPEAITHDAALLGQLYGSLAALTALAAPANVKSIRLTRTFVDGNGLDSPGRSVAGEARRLARWAWASAAFGLLVFLCAIVLLVHVDRGRRAIQQLELVQKEYQVVAGSLDVARVASGAGAGDATFECSSTDPAVTGRPAPEPAGTRQQRLLCGQLQTALVRMRIVRNELRVWNIISDRLSFISPVAWLSPPGAAGDLSTGNWESSELRTSVMMAALTGFVMPMLLGLLGACVYVYREIDDQIRTSTLEARQAVHGTLRMLLGAILGGMLGAIWTNGQAVQLEGVSLSLGALAFFVGFSVEIVFSVVDSLVRAVAGRVGKRS